MKHALRRCRSGPDPDIGPGLFLEHIGEILAAERRLDITVDIVLADHRFHHLRGTLGLGGVIDGRRISGMPFEINLAPIERGSGFADLADRILEKFARFLSEASRCAADPDIVGNHILGAASLEDGDADDSRIHRRDAARDNCLQRLHDGGTAGNRVEGHMRLRGMPAAPPDDHREFVGIRHADAVMDAGQPHIHRWPVMHAPDGLHVEFAEQPVLDHCQAAAAAFFGRLEDKIDGAVEIARLGQILRRAEKHCGVAVMTAGMHPARNLRFMLELVQLLHRQRVDIGPQPDGPVGIAISAQHADHTGLAHAAMHLDAEALELRSDKIRGPNFLVADLGMLVQFAPPPFQLVCAVGDGIDHGHGVFPVCLLLCRETHVQAVARQGQAVLPGAAHAAICDAAGRLQPLAILLSSLGYSASSARTRPLVGREKPLVGTGTGVCAPTVQIVRALKGQARY